jgi:cytochrome c biogenesis protein CcmG, thiol:disulfide interchange protein DsbE
MEAPSRSSPLKLALQTGAVVLVAALLGLLVWKIVTRQKSEAKIDKPAPAFDLSRLGAPGKVSLASLRGKPVVLNFWASWCVGCKDESKVLESAWRRWRGRVVFLGIDGSDDFSGDARAFMRRHDVSYPAVHDHQLTTVTKYGVTGYPETFFVNRQGKLVGHIVGAAKASELTTGIRDALQ